MPELRRDVVTGRLVLLAPGRAARPHTVARDDTGAALPPDGCPFCPGNESMTPPEIARTGDGAPGEPGWRVRVFPNLYPFAGGADAAPGATGAHEVIALSPDHDRSFGRLSNSQATDVMSMLRERSRALADAGHAYVQVLVNQGGAAGASIAHPHAQIVALDFVPPGVDAALRTFGDAGGDVVLDDGRDALERGLTVIERDGLVQVWCPWGSATPFETRVSLLRGGSRFRDTPDDDLASAGEALRDVLAKTARTLGDPPYNVVVHDAPSADDIPYHWWIEVVPRTSVVAGFEIGTGVMVNTVAPHEAAAALREAVGV